MAEEEKRNERMEKRQRMEELLIRASNCFNEGWHILWGLQRDMGDTVEREMTHWALELFKPLERRAWDLSNHVDCLKNGIAGASDDVSTLECSECHQWTMGHLATVEDIRREVHKRRVDY